MRLNSLLTPILFANNTDSSVMKELFMEFHILVAQSLAPVERFLVRGLIVLRSGS